MDGLRRSAHVFDLRPEQILAHIPAGLLGGFVGGALSGFLLEYLGFRLEAGR
ncbi:hypothetical protein EDC35_10862 [Thiobaca trueperi]|uniref:Uncharacterized protein n=2 Tax=Thiobaca trueperi TaxID=127458 RepID=A0A4R3MVC1_9GAMM|nr:hypothetical protein EDC35_10862 [Thiobaca trueperi]